MILLAPLAGCSSSALPDQGAGLEWVEVGETHAALMAILHEGTKLASTSDLAAAQAAASVEAKLGACVETKVAGASVEYTFTDCKGLPYGLDALSGVLEVTYEVIIDDSARPEFITLAAKGSGVSIEGATFEVNANASNVTNLRELNSDSKPSVKNALNVAGTSSGMSKEGHRFTFGPVTGSFAGTQGSYADSDRCADFDKTPPSLEKAGGTIESQGKTWIVNVESYRHCGESCPEGGAHVAVVEDLDGAPGNNTPRFLRFDGSATAKLFKFWAPAGDDEQAEPFALDCSPMK